MRVTYSEIREVRRIAGAPWFTKAWDLNLVIFRSGKVGRWDDWVVLACVDDSGAEIVRTYQATGDAWEGEWINPTHPDGCVYVLDQHVPSGMVLGTHKGRPALVQVQPCWNVRWPPGKGYVPTVDELEDLAEAGARFFANRSTNIHNRHSDWAPDKPSTGDSEGCTVHRYQFDHASFIELVNIQKSQRGTGTVSPTYVRRSALKAARKSLAA